MQCIAHRGSGFIQFSGGPLCCDHPGILTRLAHHENQHTQLRLTPCMPPSCPLAERSSTLQPAAFRAKRQATLPRKETRRLKFGLGGFSMPRPPARRRREGRQRPSWWRHVLNFRRGNLYIPRLSALAPGNLDPERSVGSCLPHYTQAQARYHNLVVKSIGRGNSTTKMIRKTTCATTQERKPGRSRQ